jgi:hypothetical protein
MPERLVFLDLFSAIPDVAIFRLSAPSVHRCDESGVTGAAARVSRWSARAREILRASSREGSSV